MIVKVVPGNVLVLLARSVSWTYFCADEIARVGSDVMLPVSLSVEGMSDMKSFGLHRVNSMD